MVDLTHVPTENGTILEWATQSPATGDHWDKVDADDAAFIETNVAAYKLDLFKTNTAIMGGSISNVRVSWKAHAYGGSALGKTSVRTHDTVYYGTPTSFATTGWVASSYYTDWAINPYTNAQWTWSEIYEMEFGLAANRAMPNAGNSIKCYYITRIVTYTDDLGTGGNIPVGDFGFF